MEFVIIIFFIAVFYFFLFGVCASFEMEENSKMENLLNEFVATIKVAVASLKLEKSLFEIYKETKNTPQEEIGNTTREEESPLDFSQLQNLQIDKTYNEFMGFLHSVNFERCCVRNNLVERSIDILIEVPFSTCDGIFTLTIGNTQKVFDFPELVRCDCAKAKLIGQILAGLEDFLKDGGFKTSRTDDRSLQESYMIWYHVYW